MLIACAAAAALTFCTPAPAADRAELHSRCVSTTLAFIAVVDDTTSAEDAQRLVDKLDREDRLWLAREVMPAWLSVPGAKIEAGVKTVFEYCMKRWEV